MAAFFLAFFTVCGSALAKVVWPPFDPWKMMTFDWPTVALVACCCSELDEVVAPGESDRRSGVKAR